MSGDALASRAGADEWKAAFSVFADEVASALTDCFANRVMDEAQEMAIEIADILRGAANGDDFQGAKTRGALRFFPTATPTMRAQLHDFFAALRELSLHPFPPHPSPRAQSLFFAAARLFPHLSWSSADVVAAVELVGPDGMVDCRSHRAGLYFQPARLFYTWHRHLAEEVYLPIYGAAEWLAGGRAPTCIPPLRGCAYHASQQAHAMRTFDEPLFALWGWRGDIAMESYVLCDAPCD